MDKIATPTRNTPSLYDYSCTEHWCSGALTRWHGLAAGDAARALLRDPGRRWPREVDPNGDDPCFVGAGPVECSRWYQAPAPPFRWSAGRSTSWGSPFNYGSCIPRTEGQHQFPDPPRRDANTFCRVQGIHGRCDEAIGEKRSQSRDRQAVDRPGAPPAAAAGGVQAWNEMPGCGRKTGAATKPP
jgi:hypothetical protein